MKFTKKLSVLLILISVSLCAYAQNNEYRKHLEKAKEYESQKKWCYALGAFYDAIISEELPANKQDAVDGYNTLVSSIKTGNPGLGKFNTFSIHDEWKNLLIDAEQFGSSFNPYVITIHDLTQGNLDYETKTATYNAKIDYKRGERYKKTIGVIIEGYKKAYKADWTDLPKEWPLYSVSYQNNSKYDINGAKVFDASVTHIYAGLCEYYLNAFSGSYFEAFGIKLQFGLYDYKFNIVDETGKELVKPRRWLLGESDYISFSNITPDIMDLIDNNKAFVNPVACYLEYGKYNPNNDTGSRNFIKNLAEVQMPVETSVYIYRNNKYDKSIDTFTSVLNYKDYIKTINALDEINSLNDTDMVQIDELKILMQKTEITQDVYEIITGGNPSNLKGSKNPVETVSWSDAIYFCNKASKLRGLKPVYSVDGETDVDKWGFEPNTTMHVLSKKTISIDMTANGYRLPTFEEWNFASKDDKYSWCIGGRKKEPVHMVAQKKANNFGLYDMKGNVGEWTLYNDDFYCCGEYIYDNNTGKGRYIEFYKPHSDFSDIIGFRIVRNNSK